LNRQKPNDLIVINSRKRQIKHLHASTNVHDTDSVTSGE